MDDVISVLEQLILLSDVEGVFLFHNFSYHSACFVGRERELEQIDKVFASGQQVLFLSGIGGIGKTELARRYAYVYGAKYRKIVFVPFAGSIQETVCGEYLHINKIEQGFPRNQPNKKPLLRMQQKQIRQKQMQRKQIRQK